MFSENISFISCKYKLCLNDKLIGSFYGYTDFKKLVRNYISTRVRELLEKGNFENDKHRGYFTDIIYSVDVSIIEFLEKSNELRENGLHHIIPEYVNECKYVRSLEKYVGKNLFQLLDLLAITIRK